MGSFSVGAQLLGFKPSAVRHRVEAGRLGLGETRVDRMEIRGMPLAEAIKRFTSRAYGVTLTFQHA